MRSSGLFNCLLGDTPILIGDKHTQLIMIVRRHMNKATSPAPRRPILPADSSASQAPTATCRACD
jgi:hypothetical protein